MGHDSQKRKENKDELMDTHFMEKCPWESNTQKKKNYNPETLFKEVTFFLSTFFNEAVKDDRKSCGFPSLGLHRAMNIFYWSPQAE